MVKVPAFMWNSYEAADNSGCIVIFETRCLFHLDSPKVSGLNSEKPDRPGSLKSNLGKEAKCAQQFDTWQQDRQQLQVSWKKQPACCTSREAHTIMLKWVAGAKTMPYGEKHRDVIMQESSLWDHKFWKTWEGLKQILELFWDNVLVLPKSFCKSKCGLPVN